MDEIAQMFLRVLAEYQLYQVPILVNDKGEELGGKTIPNERIILLSTNRDLHEREKTAIHEIIHGHDFLIRGRTNERETTKRTKEFYQQIYDREYRD